MSSQILSQYNLSDFVSSLCMSQKQSLRDHWEKIINGKEWFFTFTRRWSWETCLARALTSSGSILDWGRITKSIGVASGLMVMFLYESPLELWPEVRPDFRCLSTKKLSIRKCKYPDSKMLFHTEYLSQSHHLWTPLSKLCWQVLSQTEEKQCVSTYTNHEWSWKIKGLRFTSSLVVFYREPYLHQEFSCLQTLCSCWKLDETTTSSTQ